MFPFTGPISKYNTFKRDKYKFIKLKMFPKGPQYVRVIN